jgi:hypothetical protein
MSFKETIMVFVAIIFFSMLAVVLFGNNVHISAGTLLITAAIAGIIAIRG